MQTKTKTNWQAEVLWFTEPVQTKTSRPKHDVVNQASQCKPRPTGHSIVVNRASANQDYQAKVSQHCRAHLVTFMTPSRLQKEGCWKVAWEAWSRLTLRQIWCGADRFAFFFFFFFFCGGMGGGGVNRWQCHSSFLFLSLSPFFFFSLLFPNLLLTLSVSYSRNYPKSCPGLSSWSQGTWAYHV